MSLSRTYPVVAVAVFIAGGGLVWQEMRLGQLDREQAKLQVHLRGLVEERGTLAREINRRTEEARSPAARRKKLVDAAILHAVDTIETAVRRDAASAPARLPLPIGPQGETAFAELMNDPDYLRLWTTVAEGQVEFRYGLALAPLESEPQKADALRKLLAERVLIDREMERLGREQGLSSIDRPKARWRARDALEDEIRALAGPELYRELK